MKPSELRELLHRPPEPGYDLIAHHSGYEGEILNGYTMETVRYNFILDKFAPCKMGQLTVIVGHYNIGKTTLILWLLSKLAKSKKILMYTAENRISTIHKDFARFYTGKSDIRANELEAVRDRIRYIKNDRHYSATEMLEQSTYLLDLGFEWDIFLIDPYNALRIDNKAKLNMHDYHYTVADEMQRFSKSTKKSIFVNMHTLTESQREKLDANGERKAPLMSMVEQGGKFCNKSDDGIVLHRNPRSTIDGNKFITEVHVDRVRNQEFGGEPTRWDQPLLMKFRIDRTGFDVVGHHETKEKIKETTYNDLPF